MNSRHLFYGLTFSLDAVAHERAHPLEPGRAACFVGAGCTRGRARRRVTGPTHDLSRAAGAVVTFTVRLWRRNAVLSIVAGTTVCLVLANVARV